jgi:hypothetical protein
MRAGWTTQKCRNGAARAHSLIGHLRERTKLTETAIAMLGVLQNIAGRVHFSLVEWFAHYYDDVMGHLRYVVDGADKLPDALLCDEWSSRSRRSSAGTLMFKPSRGASPRPGTPSTR